MVSEYIRRVAPEKGVERVCDEANGCVYIVNLVSSLVFGGIAWTFWRPRDE